MKRTPLHIALTLMMIASIYGAPWVLAVVGSRAPDMEFEQLDFNDEPFVQVVWSPPQDTAADTEQIDATEQTQATATSSPSTASTANPITTARPTATNRPRTSGKSRRDALASRHRRATATPTDLMRPRTTAKRPHKPRTRPRTSTPPTKHQLRKRARRSRQRDRIAKQPQCHEMIGQIVQVDDNEWFVGRDLVGCYRAHPRQFMRMGGMAWVEDERHKRLGLRIFVSRHQRGDVARAIGIQRGDILRSLNGVPLRSVGGSSIALTQMLGSRAKLKILRHGREYRILLRVVRDDKLERAREEQAALVQD
jgi:hypothetical protein